MTCPGFVLRGTLSCASPVMPAGQPAAENPCSKRKIPDRLLPETVWADDAHIADQHVKELRKFIKMCFARNLPTGVTLLSFFRTGSAPGFVYMVRNL